jgi:hypothetical protein
VVTLDTERVGEADAHADLSFTAGLASGPTAGDAFISLVTKQIPVGCEISFENVDRTIPIRVPPTQVTNATSFSVATRVELPPDYSAYIRVFVALLGERPASDWSVQLSALRLDAERAAELRRTDAEPYVNAGPVRGKLLDAVTVKG